MLIYNPRIKNPDRRKIEGNFYSLSLPTTILDLMVETNSFSQTAQKEMAMRFARNYEHSQSLLRPVSETIRFFFVDPGGGQWVLDNGRNLRVFPTFLHSNLQVQVRPDKRTGATCGLRHGSPRGRSVGVMGRNRRFNLSGGRGAFRGGH
jgi:hypothetical protein